MHKGTLANTVVRVHPDRKQEVEDVTENAAGAEGLRAVRDAILPANYHPADFGSSGLSAEDRLDIMELPNRFNWAVDGRRYEALADLFTEDGVIDHHWGYAVGGRGIVDLVESHRSEEENVRHQTVNHSMVANGDGTVTVVAYLIAFRMVGNPGPDRLHVIAHLLQNADVRKVDGVWKFARLAVEQTVVNAEDLGDSSARAYVAATAAERARQDGRY